MKVKATITGIFELRPDDIEELRGMEPADTCAVLQRQAYAQGVELKADVREMSAEEKE